MAKKMQHEMENRICVAMLVPEKALLQGFHGIKVSQRRSHKGMRVTLQISLDCPNSWMHGMTLCCMKACFEIKLRGPKKNGYVPRSLDIERALHHIPTHTIPLSPSQPLSCLSPFDFQAHLATWVSVWARAGLACSSGHAEVLKMPTGISFLRS